jgi:ADP-ribosylglycohydrolase
MHDGIEDRIAGTLVGAAVGDALGAPYEFDIPGPTDPVMRGGGIGPWEPGEWTDDTQLTICLARAAAARRFTVEGVGDELLAWFAAGPKDVGVQTRAVLEACDHAADLPNAARERFARRPNASAGNGSLMRTAPVALAFLGDDAAIAAHARAFSGLTHAEALCGDACVLWCIAIDRAVREQRLDGVDDGLARLPTDARPQWRARIDQARAEPPDQFVPNGFVVAAFQAALSAVHHGTGFATGVRAAIAAGHDTDTTAAIAGALLGARYGRSGIPDEWQAALHGWPGLDADGLAALALQIARPA